MVVVQRNSLVIGEPMAQRKGVQHANQYLYGWSATDAPDTSPTPWAEFLPEQPLSLASDALSMSGLPRALRGKGFCRTSFCFGNLLLAVNCPGFGGLTLCF